MRSYAEGSYIAETLQGHGWSGVTPEQKDRAAGRRTKNVVAHTERVAKLQGSGYWTGQAHG